MTKTKYPKVYTLQNLQYLYSQKKLDLNPEYQRTSVWSKEQKQLFIDSLLNDIDIPKLYFREMKNVENSINYQVVDGQQRIRAIMDFYDGSFNLSDDIDNIFGRDVRSKFFNELDNEIQMKLLNTQFDIVQLVNYSDDDVEEMFTRLQNGTPLNAAEKRRALPSNLKTIVKSLSEHKVFNYVGFTDKRFAYEDTIAKIIHFHLSEQITDIRPGSIKRTYLNNSRITEENSHIIKVKKALNFIHKNFRSISDNPRLKKGSLITLTYLVSEMLEKYNLSIFKSEFADAYMNFEYERINNNKLDVEERNNTLSAYSDALRSDSVANMEFRHNTLMKHFLYEISDLEPLDRNRVFNSEQKIVIYRRDGGKCQMCGVECDPNTFHADHDKPFSKGGKTTVENGRVLCQKCNLTKSNNY